MDWARHSAQARYAPAWHEAVATGVPDAPEACEIFGDSAWMPVPKPKVQAYDPYAYWYGYSSMPAGPKLDPSEKAFLLRSMAHALGSRVTDHMLEDLPGATMAEACRLLMAILGFTCEGACPPMLRSHVVARGPQMQLYHGLTPHTLLQSWFESDELLHLYALEPMRVAFDRAKKGTQGHYITLLSRVAAVEAARPGSNRCLRAKWQMIFQLFPEVSLVRALVTHLRRHCWEDCRDRSRSRSREQRREDWNSQRFFLKNTQNLEDWQLEKHFQRYGYIVSCNVLMDKRKKQFRGMGFITMQPQGYYRGRRNTKQMMIDWVLEEEHVIRGVKVDVTEADEKPLEEVSREDRIEERRLARVDKEQRMSRSLGGVQLLDRAEQLVASPWFQHWRSRLWEVLPKHHPIAWENRGLQGVCGALWRDCASYLERTGDKTVKEALELFREEGRWAFIPAADLFLTVGEGFLGLTALGVVLSQWAEPVAPQSIHYLVNQAIPSFISSTSGPASAPLPVVPAANLRYSEKPELKRLEKGHFDDCKVFVGGLSTTTTVDQLLAAFKAYGHVTDAMIITEKATGKPRGFAFIVFETADEVARVMAASDRHHVNGKWVDVKRACSDGVA